MKRIYRVKLRGIDVRWFKKNPIVLSSWNYDDPSAVIGRATILKYKTAVEVEFFSQPPAWPHEIGASVASFNYEPDVLVGLATIPVYESLSFQTPAPDAPIASASD